MISVVICTHNRCAHLANTLAGLARIPVPPDLAWELLVVDNNSSDATRQTVMAFIRNEPQLRVKYILEPVTGLSKARNRGIAESQGTIFAFIDDDVLVSPQWLVEVRNAFQKYDAVCVSGRVLLHQNIRIPSWWHEAYDITVGKFDRGTSAIVYQQGDHRIAGIGANMMFKREAFDKYGLFRTDMGRKGSQLTTGEETEMILRLRANNETIVYCPDVLVYHCPPEKRFSKRYLLRNFYHLGEWYFLQERENPEPAPHIFGVARWKYRAALSSVRKMIWLALKGRGKESFIQQRQVAIFLGYFGAAQKAKGTRSNPVDKDYPRLEKAQCPRQ